MPTITITGASGHIGQTLCHLLPAEGWQVRALYHHDHKALEGLQVEAVQGDILNPSDMARLMAGSDMVIHAAASISIHGDKDGQVYRTNTEGTRQVLLAATAAGVRRIIHLSSTHAVHELPHDVVFDENRPYKTTADYPYDYSKAMGEQLMLQADLPGKPEVVVVRPASVLGPYDSKPSELGKALLDFYHRRIPVLPPGGYNFVDVRDVARSVIQALTLGRPGEIYLLAGHYYSMPSFAAEVKAVTGIPTPRLSLPYWLMKMMLPAVSAWAALTRAAPVYTIDALDALNNGHPNMDWGKARKELGHRCRPLSESIRDFYTWRGIPLKP